MRFIKNLRDRGFKVVTFDGYHHRVNDEFDFWLNDKSTPLRWHDRLTGDRGWKPASQMEHFVIARFTQRPTSVGKDLFVSRLLEMGWSKQDAEKAWLARQSEKELA